MMEIEPRYCQVIINRWEAYTKQKAVKMTRNDQIEGSEQAQTHN
jgi:DNA modification methylase